MICSQPVKCFKFICLIFRFAVLNISWSIKFNFRLHWRQSRGVGGFMWTIHRKDSMWQFSPLLSSNRNQHYSLFREQHDSRLLDTLEEQLGIMWNKNGSEWQLNCCGCLKMVNSKDGEF